MTPEELAEYLAMRPRYRELSAKVAEYVKSSDLPDEEIADTVGWTIETVQRTRAPKREPVKRAPWTDADVLSVLTNAWQPTDTVVAALMNVTGLTKKQAYKRLHVARDRGLIEARFSDTKQRAYGNTFYPVTHYRLPR